MALTELLTSDRGLASVFNDKVVTPANDYITSNNAEIAKLKKFQNAGGTGTAITLTGVELTDGFNLTFIATANNSATATTINGKPLYKPGTTTAPNVKIGKAITAWYNLAGDCFFLKASAEGNAVVGDVLAGKTFSNDDDTGLAGTLALTGNALVSDVVMGKTFYNTDAKAKLTGTYSNIKSIQSGTSTITNLQEINVTISSVDVDKSVVLITVKPANGDSTEYASIMARLTSQTNLNLSRKTSFVGGNIVSWQVVEFNNVKSKQTGIATIPSGSFGTFQSITISSIDIQKSLIFGSFKAIDNEQGAFSTLNIFRISSQTNIEISKAGASNSAHWQVIEFN